MNRRFWLFYAGSENYLDRYGELDYSGRIIWSCDPETVKGDLALLYRKSINHVSVEALISDFKMEREIAESIKRRRIGKDISAIWQVTSGNLGPLDRWPASCSVRQVHRLVPPIKLDELKRVPVLWKWDGLRLNLRASGRGALEIPPFAWEAIMAVIEKKCGVKLERSALAL